MSGETFYRWSINLKTKTISSEIAYSNQSTRTLIQQPHYKRISTSINIFLQLDQGEWINRNHFLISGEDVIWSVLMRRSWTPSKISQTVFYDISRHLYMDISESNKFCNKSQTPNKMPLIILNQTHAHFEHFSSLPFLLFKTMSA